MTVATEERSDAEVDRQEQIRELEAEVGPDWAKDFLPGTFGCHELLDRTSLVLASIESELLGHTACLAQPEWYALAERAAAALRDLYQQIGNEHLGSRSP